MANKEGIRKLFNNIAADYDRLNHLLSLNIDKIWRRKAVRQIVDVRKPLRVLDVACGTGDLTIEIARRVAPGSQVTGIDLSEGMMAIGREKIARAGVAAEMVLGDCEALPYEANQFDRIAVGFGVRNFEHMERGVREMFRVLVPGGRLLILELSLPTNTFIRQCYKFYFQKILPIVGGMISGNYGAYDYLPASVINFPVPKRFLEMMEQAGFCELKQKPLTFGICRIYIGTKPLQHD